MNYLKRLIRNNTGDSAKSFGLVLSTIIGALIGICICFVLIYDVAVDGVISTDLDKLGWFLMADSVYIFGGGINKVLAERYENKNQENPEEK